MKKATLFGLLGIICLFGSCKKDSRSQPPATGSTSNVVQAASASSTSRILTKESEFWKLLHPPKGEALLEASTEYAEKKREIESKLATIQDPDLRKRASDEEWGKLDKSLYINKEEEHLRVSFPSALHTFLERHRTDWFEIGHVSFPDTNLLKISSVEASPIQLPGDASIPMDVVTMDGVYSKFREMTKQEIRQTTDAWIAGQSCAAKLKIVCQNLGGSPSECSNPATLQEIEARLAGGLNLECNDHPSAEEGWRRAEEQLRDSRLVLVGQGDLISHRIDKFLLVDYNTEAIFSELPPSALKGKPEWKFPTEGEWEKLGTYLHGKSSIGQNYLWNIYENEGGQPTVSHQAEADLSIPDSESEQSVRDALPSPSAKVTAKQIVQDGNVQAAKRIVQDGYVQAAKLVNKVQPGYPPLARQTRIQGTVSLHAIIGKDGTVQQLTLESGHPLLVQSALDAVKQWRYQPTLLNGAPVEVDTKIGVTFSLTQ